MDNAAPSSSFYIDVDGDTALGTIMPTNDFNSRLHIEDATPDIAFRTIPDGGANPPIVDQTWSLFANDIAFGVCDETSYPQPAPPDSAPCSPFVIQQGSPVNSFVIRDSGFVGLGTATPAEKLHVVGPSATQFLVENTDAGAAGDQTMFELRNASGSKLRFAFTSGGDNSWTFDNDPSIDSFIVSKVGTFLNEFRIESDGDGFFRGNSFAVQHINTSSRAVKTGFAEVDPESLLEKLASLPVTEWSYISEGEDARHIGPVAEDFQEIFGLGDGKTISTVDTGGITIASIQALYQDLREKELRIQEQETTLGDQRKMLVAQEERIRQLESRLDALHASLAISDD
jgi:hypothetical protein